MNHCGWFICTAWRISFCEQLHCYSFIQLDRCTYSYIHSISNIQPLITWNFTPPIICICIISSVKAPFTINIIQITLNNNALERKSTRMAQKLKLIRLVWGRKCIWTHGNILTHNLLGVLLLISRFFQLHIQARVNSSQFLIHMHSCV